MNFEEFFKSHQPELDLQRDGEVLYCRIRKKLLLAQPEEKVRQGLVVWLNEHMGISEERLDLEVHLSSWSKGSLDRIDVLIYDENNEHPQCFFELKAPNIPLTNDVYDQAIRYAKAIQTPFFSLSNGNSFELYRWQNDAPEPLEDDSERLRDILGGSPGIQTETVEIERILDASQIRDEAYLRSFSEVYLLGDENRQRFLIDDESEASIIQLTVALYDLFQDTREVWDSSMAPAEAKEIRDRGWCYLHFGAFGGYPFNEYYRQIQVCWKDEWYLVSFAVYSYDYWKQTDGQWEAIGSNHRGCYLMVGIDDGILCHHALQMKLDRFALPQEHQFVMKHNGAMTVRKRRPNHWILDRVRQRHPDWIKGGSVDLGVLPRNKPLHFSDPDVVHWLRKTLEYALIVHELKKEINQIEG